MADYTDDFARDEDPLASGWTAQDPGMRALSSGDGFADGPVDDGYGTSYWATAVGADQYSEVKTEAVLGGATLLLAFVRMASGTDKSGMNLYIDVTGGKLYLFAWVANSPTLLTTFASEAITGATRYRLKVVGQTYTCYKDDVQVGSPYVDGGSTFTSGQPGIGSFGQTAIDSWAGGDVGTGSPNDARVVFGRGL